MLRLKKELKLLTAYYDKIAGKAIKEDGHRELESRADEVEPHIKRDDGRQFEAYDWVCNWGIPQEIAAKKMGISQPAVSNLLQKLFAKYPSLRPTIDRWQGRPDPKPERPPKPGEKGSDDIIESAGTFQDAGHGYHEPGKTSWPEEKVGSRLRAKHKKNRPD